MQAQIRVKTCKLELIENNHIITGEYDIMAGEKVIATQAFNGPYSNVKIAFSRDATDAFKALMKTVISEIEMTFE